MGCVGYRHLAHPAVMCSYSPMSDTPRLRISEIFFSLQGESATVGYPTVFVRLTGCPLRCQYCDTEYAFKGGEWLSLPAILETVAAYRTRYVTVTGGEPLAQQPCLGCWESYVMRATTSRWKPVAHWMLRRWIRGSSR